MEKRIRLRRSQTLFVMAVGIYIAGLLAFIGLQPQLFASQHSQEQNVLATFQEKIHVGVKTLANQESLQKNWSVRPESQLRAQIQSQASLVSEMILGVAQDINREIALDDRTVSQYQDQIITDDLLNRLIAESALNEESQRRFLSLSYVFLKPLSEQWLNQSLQSISRFEGSAIAQIQATPSTFASSLTTPSSIELPQALELPKDQKAIATASTPKAEALSRASVAGFLQRVSSVYKAYRLTQNIKNEKIINDLRAGFWFYASVGGLLIVSLALWSLGELRRKELKIEIQNQRVALYATMDNVTGLFGAYGFKMWLASELERAKRKGYHVGLLLFRIEGWTRLCQDWKESRRDAILYAMAQTAKGTVRQYDIVARLLPDVFAILLTECDEEGVRAVESRLKAQPQLFNIDVDGYRLNFNLNFGASVYPDQALDGQDLIDKALDNLLGVSVESSQNLPYVADQESKVQSVQAPSSREVLLAKTTPSMKTQVMTAQDEKASFVLPVVGIVKNSLQEIWQDLSYPRDTSESRFSVVENAIAQSIQSLQSVSSGTQSLNSTIREGRAKVMDTSATLSATESWNYRLGALSGYSYSYEANWSQSGYVLMAFAPIVQEEVALYFTDATTATSKPLLKDIFKAEYQRINQTQSITPAWDAVKALDEIMTASQRVPYFYNKNTVVNDENTPVNENVTLDSSQQPAQNASEDVFAGYGDPELESAEWGELQQKTQPISTALENISLDTQEADEGLPDIIAALEQAVPSSLIEARNQAPISSTNSQRRDYPHVSEAGLRENLVVDKSKEISEEQDLALRLREKIKASKVAL